MMSTQEDRIQANLERFKSLPKQSHNLPDKLRELKRVNALDLCVVQNQEVGTRCSETFPLVFHQGVKTQRAYKEPFQTSSSSVATTTTAGPVLAPTRLDGPEISRQEKSLTVVLDQTGLSTGKKHSRWVDVMGLEYTGTRIHQEQLRLGWQPTPWRSSMTLQTRPPSGRPVKSLAIHPQGLVHVSIEPPNFAMETKKLQVLLSEYIQARLISQAR